MEVLNIGENVVHEVVIVGAGIAGLAVAIALKNVGIKSLVLEKSSELRSTGAALLILQNAWRALEVLGISEKLDKHYKDFQLATGCITNLVTGSRQEFSMLAGSSSTGKRMMRPIHRKFLMETLAAELPPESIRFLCKLSSVKSEVSEDFSTVTVLEMEDGSVFRAKVHQEIARDPEMVKNDVLKTAKDFPPEYHQVVSNCDPSTLTMAPLLFRVPWDIIFGPSHHGGVTVTGDAFHPMTPDLGQGGCSALEDAVVLARNIANMPDNVCYAIENYVKERRWRAARLVTASYFSGVLEPCQSRGVFGRLWESFRQYAFNWLVHSKYGTLNYDCGTLSSAQNFSLN
ncbi:hypothetical protein J5N97_016507 [Dioscorea zingiberensis]|uniref:FAD-binding domain-containing protein n=1 Tax=Dioscorea zingiberensis TaxID=325984 RepID=A0A9D5CK00_9LILI|nr:hypothetical protein J5N97_016507 [Dioscorea zingiberensis]